METLASNYKSYTESKSIDLLKECLKQALEKIQSASSKSFADTVKTLCGEGLLDILKLAPEDFDRDCKISLNKIINLASESKYFSSNCNLILPQLKACLRDSKDKEILISALDAETSLISKSAVTVDALVESDILSLNKNFFNRKVELNIVLAAAKCMVEAFKLKPKEQVLTILIDGLIYCVTHINLEVIHLGIKAANSLVTDSPEMADHLIKISFYDDIYAQFRHPMNPVKAEILALFTKTAQLGPRFQKFVREHTISDRISAFLCHYNDVVCMECLNLLETLDYSVKTSIEHKYIITLILHISMSAYEFKKKSFDLLEKYLYKADASQVRTISDEGYIRPFLTLACDTNTNMADKERILNLIKFLIEKYDILKIRIVQFDFDHAHNADEFSCVNQLMQLMEENSSNLKITASYILDCLRKIDIVNNMRAS